MSNKLVIGGKEWCSLPQLNLPAIKMKIDSGAKTTALHAFNIRVFNEDGKTFAKFDVHPIQNNRSIIKRCVAQVIDHRMVKSSNGRTEKRLVITTPMTLGDRTWDVEITLTNRDPMGYRMLLGREAMKNLLVDPEAAYLLSNITVKEARHLYKSNVAKKAALNIILLGSNPELYSNKRIIEAGEVRGHNMRFINLSYCYMNVCADEPVVYYRGGERLENIDAVIPRIRPSMTFYGTAVTRQFQIAGAFSLNEALAITRARDKLRCLQMLVNKGISMPITGFANSFEDTKHLIKMVGGAPLIVKLLESTQGNGVVLAETYNAAESVINAFKSLKVNILVQEFIKEAKGKDLRCFVVNGKVVGAMERAASEGEFRANLHLGGVAHKVKLTADEKKMAILAAKILGLKVAGVDILRSNDGPKIIEVNSSPGLSGIESVTGEDIAGYMIECIEQQVLGTK